jgi:hypothetical protein
MSPHRFILPTLLAAAALPAFALEPLYYNNPGLVVDLAVGLWAGPLPMDFNGDGNLDIVVSCPDKPYNGLYVFENVSARACRTRRSVTWMESRASSRPRPSIPISSRPASTSRRKSRCRPTCMPEQGPRQFLALRGFRRRRKTDIVVGADDWTDYGWDNAYTPAASGRTGRCAASSISSATPARTRARLCAAGENHGGRKAGRDLRLAVAELRGLRGTGKLDLICGEFLDGFTFFENIGTRTRRNTRRAAA